LITFGETACDKLLLKLINTREFRGCVRIKQLGFSETVFPGANHSRFAHCIGTLQNGQIISYSALQEEGGKLDERVFLVVSCTALLHDLGHGPFSHALRKLRKIAMRNRTREIVESEETEVQQHSPNTTLAYLRRLRHLEVDVFKPPPRFFGTSGI